MRVDSCYRQSTLALDNSPWKHYLDTMHTLSLREVRSAALVHSCEHELSKICLRVTDPPIWSSNTAVNLN